MAEELKEKNDIKTLSKMLTEENKRYVIAVANALLFTQKEEKELSYRKNCREMM